MGIKKNRDVCYEAQAWGKIGSPGVYLYLNDKGEYSWSTGEEPGTYLLFYDEVWLRGISNVEPLGPIPKFKPDKLLWIPRGSIVGTSQLYLTREYGPDNEGIWYYYPRCLSKQQEFYISDINSLPYSSYLVPIRPWELK